MRYNCPKCGAACGDVFSVEDHTPATLAEIEQLCRRHNHPGVNVGAMALAGRVIEIIEDGRTRTPDTHSTCESPGPRGTIVTAGTGRGRDVDINW